MDELDSRTSAKQLKMNGAELRPKGGLGHSRTSPSTAFLVGDGLKDGQDIAGLKALLISIIAIKAPRPMHMTESMASYTRE